MKIDLKKRNVQQKYKEKIAQKKEGKKHSIEVILVAFSIILLLMLNGKYSEYSKSSNYFEDPSIEFDDFEKSQRQFKWMEVIPKIDNKLKGTNSKYRGITIDFNPKSIKYFLNTSIQESNSDTEEDINELINTANQFIKSNNLSTLLKENETYEIIVRGKNKKELKRKVFFKRVL